MRRTFVLALALLTVSLTGGSCEFRASSGAPIQPRPPEVEPHNGDSGLLIVINAGDSIAPASASTITSTTVAAAMAVSVLSAPESQTASPTVSTLRIQEAQPHSATPAQIASIERPIPEPRAALLFGVGTLVLGGWVGARVKRGVDSSGTGLH